MACRTTVFILNAVPHQAPELIHPTPSTATNYILTSSSTLALTLSITITPSLPPKDPLAPTANKSKQISNVVIMSSVAGFVVMVVMTLIVIVLLLCFCYRPCKQKQGSDTSSINKGPTITNPTYTGQYIKNY